MKEKKIAQSEDIPLEKLTYEQAFAELESIVAELETGEQALEASMALFERGQALARYCTTRLDQAELKIHQLTGGTLSEYMLQE